MDEEKRDGESSAGDEEVDFDLAMEAARELPPEYLNRCADVAVDESLTDEEREQKIEEVLKEMNVLVNEIYRQKKQGRSQ